MDREPGPSSGRERGLVNSWISGARQTENSWAVSFLLGLWASKPRRRMIIRNFLLKGNTLSSRRHGANESPAFTVTNCLAIRLLMNHELNGVALVYTRFIARTFLFAASCLLMVGLAARSDLKGAPLYKPSDVFPAGASGHEPYPRVLLGLPDTGNLDWPEFTPTNIISNSQGPLQGAIFFTLLVGGIVRYLMSDTVRRFFQDIFGPLNWNSYQ